MFNAEKARCTGDQRSLVLKSRASLREEGEGDIMTKAILDVDDCAEGMRKFTISKDRTVISISHRMTASMGRTIFIS